MDNLRQLSKQAIDAVIRPPRSHYDKTALPIKIFCSDGHQFMRHPVIFQNDRGNKIIGSIYRGYTSADLTEEEKLTKSPFDIMDGGPCVIYLHRNASSQNEGTFLIPNLCPYGISVFLFDFAGCGESEGEYISLGLNESKDLRKLIYELYTHFNLGPFILWGRSMGASTTLMLNAQDYVKEGLVAGYIIDSGFAHLYDVCYSIASRYGVPWGIDTLLYWYLRYSVNDVAKFDPNDVNPIEFARLPNNPPVIFGHAKDDDIVPYQQGVDLFNAYSNPDKQFVELSRGHNGERPNSWLFKCFNFIFRIFDKAQNEPEDNLHLATHAKSTGALNEMQNKNDSSEKQRMIIRRVNSNFSLFKLHKINSLRRRSTFHSYQELVDLTKECQSEDKAIEKAPLESDMNCTIYTSD